MGRQLFLHHYLPAHLASALVTGALLEFIFNLDPVGLEDNLSHQVQIQPQPLPPGSSSRQTSSNSSGSGSNSNSKATKDRGGKRIVLPAREAQSQLALWAAAGVVLTLVIGGWYFFLPLTYGKPGLDPDQVNARKWLGYDLHFAK